MMNVVSMEPIEEVKLKELGESELERLVRGWRREDSELIPETRGSILERRNDLLFVETNFFVHPRSPRQYNRITESIMPLLTRPLCCFRHY